MVVRYRFPCYLIQALNRKNLDKSKNKVKTVSLLDTEISRVYVNALLKLTSKVGLKDLKKLPTNFLIIMVDPNYGLAGMQYTRRANGLAPMPMSLPLLERLSTAYSTASRGHCSLASPTN